jgi:cell wall-associated NlpC family hydrolase
MDDFAGRYLIVQYALSCWNGHYLSGARGGIPGGPSCVGRSVDLNEDSSWGHLSIHAAKNSLQRCYGRWAAFGKSGYLFQPGSKELTALKAYWEEHKGEPPESWPSFETEGLTPRRIGKSSDSAIALGEDCRDKRHFDCIGFIYWAYNQVLPNNSWASQGISGYAKGFTSSDKRINVKSLGELGPMQIQSGDIVTRTNTTPKHIGIGISGGTVIHASRESDGVLIEPFLKGNWTGVSRISVESFEAY